MRASALGLALGSGFWLLGGVALATASPTAGGQITRPEPDPSPTQIQAPGYSGHRACRPCHEKEHAAWRGSHHDLAMAVASQESVLGRFDGSSLEHGSMTAHFVRRGDDFFIRTQGPDGDVEEFRVAYTFGAYPLQQYLMALPGGRLQASVVAWDARPTDEGGQRWFRLRPDEAIPPGDVLHWTGPALNWNTMCADCHSTRLRKNYDPTNDTFASTWAEIDVACEACHGPGREHIAWAATLPPDSPLVSKEGLRATFGKSPAREIGLEVDLAHADPGWTMQPSGIARRAQPLQGRGELDTCAPCHSRRSEIADPEAGRPFLDSHMPSLLADGLYWPDGQMRDEVYVYGSFVQSKMYRAGVTCGDCHDPHSLQVRSGTDGVCAQCHAEQRFATADHHGHQSGTPGAQCVNCHMPATTYMEIDARRDHSFRIPQPIASAALGAPDVCRTCHPAKDAAWAEGAIRTWAGGGKRSAAAWPAALNALRKGDSAGVTPLLAAVAEPTTAAVVRATVIEALGAAPSPLVAAAIATAASDGDDLVRLAAARAIEGWPREHVPAPVWQLLEDSRRAVRIEAGRVLAIHRGHVPSETRKALDAAIAAYRRSQERHRDQPSALLNLGALEAALRRPDAAETAYKAAIANAPYFIPAFVNLADLYRSLGRDTDAEAILRQGIGRHPDSADLRHALGLALVRQKRLEEALGELAAAANGAAESARYAYVYGVALHSSGQTERAIAVLEKALAKHPYDDSIRQALIAYYRNAGQLDRAQKLSTQRPSPR